MINLLHEISCRAAAWMSCHWYEYVPFFGMMVKARDERQVHRPLITKVLEQGIAGAMVAVGAMLFMWKNDGIQDEKIKYLEAGQIEMKSDIKEMKNDLGSIKIDVSRIAGPVVKLTNEQRKAMEEERKRKGLWGR